MNETMVECVKKNARLPGLGEAPFVGKLGEIILQNISEEAWREWVELEIKIINEERLDLSEERAQLRLFDHMIEALNLKDLVRVE